MKQTILGAGGAIGMELAKALTRYTTDIRLVSRNPKKVNPTDELLPADLLDAEAVRLAVKGSSI
ncbi:MAG: NAD-dependent dehydratase, partial [Flavobacteriaceae bacterium]